MNRLEVIQTIINKTKTQTYLEIGVRYGTVFLRIRAPRKIAVDPLFKIPLLKKVFFMMNNLNSAYYQKTSDDFFREDFESFKDKKIDVAFIDGMHTYEQSLKDVKNCLRYLNEGGVVILHDCNPVTEAMAAPSYEIFKEMPQRGKAWCGGVWKTIVHLRSLHDDLNIFVLDCDYGLGIVTRGSQENVLTHSADEIKKMTYSDLADKRETMLNLKHPEYFYEFISTIK